MKRPKLKKSAAEKLLKQQRDLAADQKEIARKLEAQLEKDKAKLVKKAAKAMSELAEVFPACVVVANGIEYQASDIEIRA